MLLIGKIIVFLVGMGLAVQVVAAFYSIIDLWYSIRTEYPRVLRGILFWCGLSGFIAFLLGGQLRPAFLWGMLFYLPFYLVQFYLFQGIIRYRYRKGGEIIPDDLQDDSY
ncbi:MAG: hypothetical protein SD837_04980 [Candidatus Electrothrix scaldis]|nr:MAG: hypothetical protein SD837_04980 [Candidatus Electrothrix sp. GW3-3]